MTKLKGKISIGKVNCSNQDDYMHIQITDASSSITFIDAEMSLLDFALAITGQGYVDIEYQHSKSDNLGKNLEVKHEAVTFDGNLLTLTDEIIRQELIKWETDGWMAYDKDAKNYHNHISRVLSDDGKTRVGAPPNTYNISFHRYG